MVDIVGIIRDEAIPNERTLEDVGVSEDDAVRQLHQRSPLVVGVPNEPTERMEYFRQCMSIVLAAQFGRPWTVGRLRLALARIDDTSYPET